MDLLSFIAGFVFCGAGVSAFVITQKVVSSKSNFAITANWFMRTCFGGAFALICLASQWEPLFYAMFPWMTGSVVAALIHGKAEMWEVLDPSSARAFVLRTAKKDPARARMVAKPNGITLDGQNA